MARSEAFRVMFSSNMREGSKEGARQVPVHEVTHDAFRCMLHFLYGAHRDAPRTHGPHATSSHHPAAPLPLQAAR